MEQLSMWEATANTRKKRQTLRGDRHCDVAVIGAGFSGISTAYHLQKKKCETIVLEKETVGFGASGRNGGEVLAGYVVSASALAKTKGLETAREMMRLSVDSIDLIEDLIEKHEIDCSFKRSGEISAA
ncbi:MAG TPA: FAD-dependent oxidoreductase, partial [Bacillales bacterium]|nr:FAD-dependent oxidoreductase [Bacillales bacterium]